MAGDATGVKTMQAISVMSLGWGVVIAQLRGGGHMGDWGWGMAIFGWVFMIAILGLVVWLVVHAIRRPETDGKRSSALDLLDERYARGEIEREEYLKRRADLERR
jgi:putative membrane protein